MDRNIVYPGSIPLDTDLLSTNRNAMVALGLVMQATLGTGTVVDGLACSPTSPASLTVTVGPGSIMQASVVDATGYGSLAADTSDPLMKMGINLTATSFTLSAPVVAGQSVNYLIQVSLQETDSKPLVLPYYNAANPAQPYSGPNNSGTAQNTVRAQTAQLQLKAGSPAGTGTQTTPPVDNGWAGLYVITVSYGQTQISASSIATLPGAPFIQFKLPALAPGFSRIQAFTSSATFSVPAGVTRLRARAWGGGGGGGGSTGSGSAASGGGGGAYGEGIYAVTPGQSIPITVGGGGSGAGGAGNGAAGGTSSVGTLLSTTGGQGGIGSGGGTQSSVGVGGAAIGAAVSIGGTNGGGGSSIGGTPLGGPGGGAFGTGYTQISAIGQLGVFPGGGGGGGATGQSGASGAGGLVVLEW